MAESQPNHTIMRLYGYVVCIIAIITAIISVSLFIDKAFSYAAPLRATNTSYYSGIYSSYNLTSYESFKADYEQNYIGMSKGDPAAPDTTPTKLTDTELKATYDREVTNRTEQVRFDAAKGMVINGFLILIAAALFGTHWRWLNRMK